MSITSANPHGFPSVFSPESSFRQADPGYRPFGLSMNCRPPGSSQFVRKALEPWRSDPRQQGPDLTNLFRGEAAPPAVRLLGRDPGRLVPSAGPVRLPDEPLGLRGPGQAE